MRLSFEDFRDNIEIFRNNLEKGVVSQEKHKDRGLHLHAAICLLRPVDSRDKRLFDKLVDPPHHPNIAGRFTGGRWKLSIMWWREELLAAKREIIRLEGILEAKQEKKSSQAALIVKRIRQAPVEDVMGEQQGLHAAPRQASRDYVAWRQEAGATLEVARPKLKKVFVVPAPVTSTHGTTRLLLGWRRIFDRRGSTVRSSSGSRARGGIGRPP